MGVKMTGVEKCLGCKMSGCQSFLDLYAVAQCMGGTMSGWKNVLLSKCLGVKMSRCCNVRCQNVSCRNVGESARGLFYPSKLVNPTYVGYHSNPFLLGRTS